VGAYAYNAVFWALDGVGAAFTAGGWVSRVRGAICVLCGALDAVSEADAAGNIGVDGHDMVTAGGSSGYGQGGWGAGWGAVGRFSSVCRRF
jgi:hypothetical protein